MKWGTGKLQTKEYVYQGKFRYNKKNGVALVQYTN